MLISLAMASILASGEIEFPDECVLAYSEKDSVASWGGYNYDKAFLDTAKIDYYDPLEAGDYRTYRVRKWFSEAVKNVIHDAEMQMEFDIAVKSKELLEKIKERE